MAGLGHSGRTNGARLRHFAIQLKPVPSREPFYVWRPRDEGVEAPGWYMIRGGKTLYLGACSGAAEVRIRELLSAQVDRRRTRGTQASTRS